MLKQEMSRLKEEDLLLLKTRQKRIETNKKLEIIEKTQQRQRASSQLKQNEQFLLINRHEQQIQMRKLKKSFGKDLKSLTDLVVKGKVELKQIEKEGSPRLESLITLFKQRIVESKVRVVE